MVPTGNFGDAFAGIAAKKMGLPAAGFVAAVNQNDALARAINDGVYARHPAVESGSVSMDVQAPSNFERLVYEASGRDADATRAVFETFAREGSVTLSPDLLAALRAEVSAVSVDEATTKAEIAHAHAAWGRIVCPHTAVALAAARRLTATARRSSPCPPPTRPSSAPSSQTCSGSSPIRPRHPRPGRPPRTPDGDREHARGGAGGGEAFAG